MATIDNMDLGVRNILAIALWLAGVERGFVFAPDHEQARLLLFAKLDELATEAESDDREKRNRARIAILGFVMLLEKIAAEEL